MQIHPGWHGNGFVSKALLQFETDRNVCPTEEKFFV